MKRVLTSCLSAALLLGSLTTAHAAISAETFTLTPFLGGYTFDGKQQLETMPVVGLRAGYNFTESFGTEAVFDYVRTEATRRSSDANLYSYHLDLLYHFLPSSRTVPFVMAGYGGSGIDQDGHTVTRGTFNYGIGLKYALTESMQLRGEVRHLIYRQNDETLNNIEYGIGLGFPFGEVKSAAKPVAAPPQVEQPKVAPPAVAAPVGSLWANPSPVTKGATATLAWQCKDATSADIQPEIGQVPVQGSRTVTALNSTDYTLTCTGPGGKGTAKSTLAVTEPLRPACTISADPAVITEGQATMVNWECRNSSSAEISPQLGTVPLKGSKSVIPQETTTYTIKGTGPGATTTSSTSVTVKPLPPEKRSITLDIQFDTGKADIKKKYHAEIGRVAAFLKEYPGVKGTLEGHTDNVGAKKMNMKLSERRANAVLNYLVNKYGIDRSRLSAVGYGPTRPIADNGTAAGRQQNRRTVATFETMVVKKK